MDSILDIAEAMQEDIERCQYLIECANANPSRFQCFQESIIVEDGENKGNEANGEKKKESGSNGENLWEKIKEAVKKFLDWFTGLFKKGGGKDNTPNKEAAKKLNDLSDDVKNKIVEYVKKSATENTDLGVSQTGATPNADGSLKVVQKGKKKSDIAYELTMNISEEINIANVDIEGMFNDLNTKIETLVKLGEMDETMFQSQGNRAIVANLVEFDYKTKPTQTTVSDFHKMQDDYRAKCKENEAKVNEFHEKFNSFINSSNLKPGVQKTRQGDLTRICNYISYIGKCVSIIDSISTNIGICSTTFVQCASKISTDTNNNQNPSNESEQNNQTEQNTQDTSSNTQNNTQSLPFKNDTNCNPVNYPGVEKDLINRLKSVPPNDWIKSVLGILINGNAKQLRIDHNEFVQLSGILKSAYGYDWNKYSTALAKFKANDNSDKIVVPMVDGKTTTVFGTATNEKGDDNNLVIVWDQIAPRRYPQALVDSIPKPAQPQTTPEDTTT